MAIDETPAVQSFHDQVEGGTDPRGNNVEASEQRGLGERGVGTPTVEPELECPTGRTDIAGDRGGGSSPCGGITRDHSLVGERRGTVEPARRRHQRMGVARRGAADLPDPVVGITPVLHQPAGEGRHRGAELIRQRG